MELLQILWYMLWSLLWCIYFSLDGFDFGSAIAMPFIAKNEDERKLVLTTFGPFWDGNEVWLITAGGVAFAAFPIAYASMFSWFYVPIFIVLLSLIVRGFSVELRGKVKNRKLFDLLIFTSSLMAIFLFGVLWGNLWSAVDIRDEGYSNGMSGLLNLTGILTGVFFTVVFLIYGLIWLLNKIEGVLKYEVYTFFKKVWYIGLVLYLLFLIFNPLFKNPNYKLELINGKIATIFYIFSMILFFISKLFIDRQRYLKGFFSYFVFILFIVGGQFAGNFPNLIAAKNPQFNITAFNSSSSFYTLKLMLIVVLIFIPLVIFYQIWVYRVFRDKITIGDIKNEYY
ncbi:MAG: cytochrome d ubiquinol oxidase subunit II [Elusimicrobiota bacterium]